MEEIEGLIDSKVSPFEGKLSDLESINKSFLYDDTTAIFYTGGTTETVNGVTANTTGLLRNSNTVQAFSIGGLKEVYLNVPVLIAGSRANTLEIGYYQVGGVGYFTNLIGKRPNGELVDLLPAVQDGDNLPHDFRVRRFDLEEYESVSFMLMNEPNTGETPYVKFFKRQPAANKDDNVKKYVDTQVEAALAGATGLRPYVLDIKMEGAKGDGVSDDTEAFNNALLKLKALGGGKIS